MPDLLFRTLPAKDVPIPSGTVRVLDQVIDDGVSRTYLARGTNVETVFSTPEHPIDDVRSIGEGLLVRGTSDNNTLPLVDSPLFTPSKVETDLFDGLNTLLSVRNGESPQDVVDWLTYHHEHHGAQAALIVDRAPNDPHLDDALRSVVGLTRIVVLRSQLPLGDATLPSETHPYCAPTAPGKDRMKVPPPSPWDSPLRELLIYEIAKIRFLAKARAVANIEVCDLLAPVDGKNIFDAAVSAQGGVITLAGRRCFPWRVRQGHAPHFSDHTCVQFDTNKAKKRWCVAPSITGPDTVWRMIRVVGADADPAQAMLYYNCMNMRHRHQNISAIVPKTSLVEDSHLLALSRQAWGASPVPVPAEKLRKRDPNDRSTVIVTCMKNEGPFILEWIAYHRAIGVENFIVYTNDCDDGTDTFLDLLQAKGYLQHRENPFKGTDLKPQHAALAASENEAIVQNSAWAVSMDVDEFICVHTGDGTLGALFDAVPDANMISITWRLFGNAEIHEFEDHLLTENYTRCAREFANKPHQAWGFKTLFRQDGIFKKLGVHRPKGLRPQLKDSLRWVNGSGRPMPQDSFRNAWRSTSDTYGYDLVSLNHYAVRSAESFLVKRDRGRVNHVDRDQGLAYWFRMNNNEEEDTSILRMVPRLKAELAQMLSDPKISAQHSACVLAHRDKIKALRKSDSFEKFYTEITSPRMERLGRLHKHFGANVFLGGPETVPDDVVFQDHSDDFFFTVERQDTQH